MFFAFFFYMNSIWHYSLPLAGLAIPPGPLLVIPVAAMSGRIASRHGHRPLLVAGSLLYATSALWFLLVPGIEPAYLSQWLPGMLLSGVGVGMVLPSLAGHDVAGSGKRPRRVSRHSAAAALQHTGNGARGLVCHASGLSAWLLSANYAAGPAFLHDGRT